MLLCDASELREALTNIVFNAVDAIPAGGDIAIITRAVTRPASEAGANPARELQLEVRDNGTGMEEKVRQHCLEPFFSTKTQRGGSGLGLAMVYGMVQRHQGNINPRPPASRRSAPSASCALTTNPACANSCTFAWKTTITK